MKRVLILIMLMLALPSFSYALEVGDEVQDFKIVTLRGGEEIAYYADLKGKKPVYLMLWATW